MKWEGSPRRTILWVLNLLGQLSLWQERYLETDNESVKVLDTDNDCPREVLVRQLLFLRK